VSNLNPRNSDAILGGQTPPPSQGAILGGIDGAKQRFANEAISAKLSALSDAFQYGEEGIALALKALQDPAEEVQRYACRLLRRSENQLGKLALLEHRPLSYFTTLSDWRHEIYNPEIGIVDPENNAYIVRMTNSGRLSPDLYDRSQFEALIKDPKLSQLQALIFEIDRNYWDHHEHSFGYAIEAIGEAKELMPDLKALFVGDYGSEIPEFKKSKVAVFDIRPFLEAFPKLEVLQIFGAFGKYHNYILDCEGLSHASLKTLIIETADMSWENADRLCSMDLPALEYFELWFGRYYCKFEPLDPILQGEVYPNLKYLGLCSSERVEELAYRIVLSPLMQQLAVLDFKKGTLNDSGLEPLLDRSLTSNLKILNISGNNLSEDGLRKLAEQPYHVIAADQQIPTEDYYYSGDDYSRRQPKPINRYRALYE
jgi:hypothetical protein